MKFLTTILWGTAALGMFVRGAVGSEADRPTAARNTQAVAWQDDLDVAWQATQRDGRLLLVFVTRDNCHYCDKMKDRTYGSATVATSVAISFVPLLVDGRRSCALLRELNVRAYPSTFVISPQAVVLDRIDGYVTPEVLAARLEAVRPRPPSGELAADP